MSEYLELTKDLLTVVSQQEEDIRRVSEICDLDFDFVGERRVDVSDLLLLGTHLSSEETCVAENANKTSSASST